MKKPKGKPKIYICRSYVSATSLSDARRKFMKREPDEIWISDEWKGENNRNLADAIGFHVIEAQNEEE